MPPPTVRMFCCSVLATPGAASRMFHFNQMDGAHQLSADSEVMLFDEDASTAFEVGKFYDVTFTEATQ